MTTQHDGIWRLRWLLVSSLLVNLVLFAIIVKGNVSDRAGELVNKQEWSMVAAARHRNDVPVNGKIVFLPKAFGEDAFDMIGIPTRDGKRMYWILSNAYGIPSLKANSDLKPRMISHEELKSIRSSVRTNKDVDTLLAALLL